MHDGPARLVLRHVSPDGDQGFPGEVTVAATYRLDAATLWLEFEAVTTRPTPLSLSAHPYFNLAGPQARDILDHQVEIISDRFLPVDEHQIPTGEICAVGGTVFDFMTPVAAGERIRCPRSAVIVGARLRPLLRVARVRRRRATVGHAGARTASRADT